MGRDLASRTFIPLFPEPWNAASLERLLSALGVSAGVPTRCVRPPLTGLAFLSATGQIGALIDEWWRVNVPSDSLPVLLMLHEPELPDWLGELEAAFVIGVTERTELALYQGADPARVAVVVGGPPEVAEHAIRLYGSDGAGLGEVVAGGQVEPGPGERRPGGEPYPEPASLKQGPGPGSAVERRDPRPPGPATQTSPAPAQEARPLPRPSWTSRPAAVQAPDPGLRPAPTARPPRAPAPPTDQGPGRDAGPPPGQQLDPFNALVAARPITSPAAAAPSRAGRQVPHPRLAPQSGPATQWRRPASSAPPSRIEPVRARRGGLRAFLRDLFGLHGRTAIPDELIRLALAHNRGKIVGVISRAGGVGKTATAAALGIIFGEAVHRSGWSAAVIDQNTGNPDQWGRLELDEHVTTVSEIMANIEAGRSWSIPTWGRTPALAVYPESRLAGDAYAPAQIERLAGQLRRLHMLSVIDLPNRLPAFTNGEAALSAGWISAVDLLTIPTTDDPMRLQGVIELLDTPLIKGDARSGYRSVPVVIAYLRSPMRAIRQSAAVSRTLDYIRERVLDVVEIPKDERATLAIVQGKPITEIDPRLRRAYIDLALAIASALAEA